VQRRERGSLRRRVQPAFQEVLDRLDVVPGLGLDGGEFGDLRLPETLDDAAQVGGVVVGQRRGPGDGAPRGEVEQPLHLHPHARAVERRLREVVHDRGDDGAVAAVEGAEGERVELREVHHGAIVAAARRDGRREGPHPGPEMPRKRKRRFNCPMTGPGPHRDTERREHP